MHATLAEFLAMRRKGREIRRERERGDGKYEREKR